MEWIRMARFPSSRATTIPAVRSPTATVLKPHVSPRPSSGRRSVTPIEAVVTRLPERAALGADDASTPSTSTISCRDTVMGDLISIERLGWGPRAVPHRPVGFVEIPDLGDLQRLSSCTVAR